VFIFLSLVLPYSGQSFELDVITVGQKIVALFILFFLIVRYGVNYNSLGVFNGFLLAVICSSIGAALIGVFVDYKLLIVSFVSLSISLLLFSVKYDSKVIAAICLQYMPLVSVVLGILAMPLGYTPWVDEYTGAIRLRGALIPAHLAMLCVVAVYSYVILDAFNVKQRPLILILNILIAFLSGTRGGLIAIFISLMPYFFRLTLMNKRTGVFYIIAMLPISFLMAIAAYYIFSLRGDGGQVEEPFNLSGRAIAWEYFIDMIEYNPVFGTGLGSVTTATQDELVNNLSAFVVPHNEYIRFLVDLGWFGLIIFLSFFIWQLVAILRLHHGYQRWTTVFIVISFMIYAATDNLISTIQFSIPLAILGSFLREWKSRA
jgi:hypothetical protein